MTVFLVRTKKKKTIVYTLRQKVKGHDQHKEYLELFEMQKGTAQGRLR